MGSKIVIDADHGGDKPCAIYRNRKEVKEVQMNETQTDETQTDETQTDETQMNETQTVETQMNETLFYKVQVGEFKVRGNSDKFLYRLQAQGFPAFIVSKDGYYRVHVGAFMQLDKAVAMELNLRQLGYSTYIVTF